jgi:L-aspartate oxidase
LHGHRRAGKHGRPAVPTLSALPTRPRRPTDPLTKALRIITPPPAAPSTATVAHGSIVQADVAVVGAGVGGLVTALDALDADPSRTVVVIDKGQAGASGSTPLAQGGMAAAVGPGDTAEAHANDTVAAGDGLADPDAAAVLATEAPDRVADLQRRGVRFDVEPDGRWHLAREGGQSRPRSVHVADHTGAAIFQALRDTATGRVTRLQGTAHALAVAGHAPRRVTGVWVLLDEIDATAAGPTQHAGQALVAADAVVLATGGCGGLYAATTNRAAATADGVALAWRAGATLADCEFVQFHPTGLRTEDLVGSDHGHAGGDRHETAAGDSGWRLLLTEALRGAGAVLVDCHHRRFMDQRHPDAELAPRHIVARGILEQPGGAWLDCRPVGAARLAEEFPTVLAGARRAGIDLATEPAPVEPTQHYMIGGVATDLWGATTLPGLWAVGETAAPGVHGANRMAGNSLAEACVLGHRAAVAISAWLDARQPASAPRPPGGEPPPLPAGGDHRAVAALLATAREAMAAGAGPLRDAHSLATCDKTLAHVGAQGEATPADTRQAVELDAALTVGRLIVRSARLRRESRGAHVREDAAERDPAWAGVRLRVRRDVAGER